MPSWWKREKQTPASPSCPSGHPVQQDGGAGMAAAPWAHRVLGNAAEMATAGSWLCGRESVGRQANACSLYCSEEISQLHSTHMKPTGLELLRYATERGRDVIVPCSSSGPSWPARSPSKGSDRSHCWSAPGTRDISLGSAGDEKKQGNLSDRNSLTEGQSALSTR